jgi:hypothetical protein
VKYRKKPIVVEAFIMGVENRPDWFQDEVTKCNIETRFSDNMPERGLNPFEFRPTYCLIKTLEGIMKGDYGDYIIKGVNGEIYPCKPEIFEKTYEKVEIV